MIVLFFLASILLFLTAGFMVGFISILIALVVAVGIERGYEASHPETVKHSYAGFWVRSGSLFVDTGINYALLGLMYILVGKQALDEGVSTGYALAIMAVNLYMLKRWGQSPGKMVMGIKIVTAADYQAIGWDRIFLRNIFDVLQSLGSLSKTILIAFGVFDINLKIAGNGFLPPDSIKYMSDKFHVLFTFWLLSEVFVLLTNRRRRALHDFLAGTVVVVDEKVPRYRWIWVTAAIFCIIGFLWFGFKKSTSVLRESADKGDAIAQRAIAEGYRNGLGVPKDYALALQWYQKAANQGDARAEVELGEMYEWGFGVPPNKAEAVRWYSLAAKSGDWLQGKKAELKLKELNEKSN
jgi:hypothetical protein